jgi:hypothetical protein
MGDIEHLRIDKIPRRITYAVMSFGGFLGPRHSDYPVPRGALNLRHKAGPAVASVQGRSPMIDRDHELSGRNRALRWESAGSSSRTGGPHE